LFVCAACAQGDAEQGRCYRRHRHAGFIAFFQSLAKRYPKLALHLNLQRLAGPTSIPLVKQRLTVHPRFDLRFTPTSAWWLNLVARWSVLITNPGEPAR
jgi:hypothetical protein